MSQPLLFFSAYFLAFDYKATMLLTWVILLSSYFPFQVTVTIHSHNNPTYYYSTNKKIKELLLTSGIVNGRAVDSATTLSDISSISEVSILFVSCLKVKTFCPALCKHVTFSWTICMQPPSLLIVNEMITFLMNGFKWLSEGVPWILLSRPYWASNSRHSVRKSEVLVLI